MNRFCALLFLSACLLAASPPDDQTVGLKNGRYWHALHDDLALKAVYLEAMVDGWMLRGQAEDAVGGKIAIIMSRGGSFTYGELARTVDATYSFPENLGLPIGWVTMATLAVQRGETTREVALSALRKHLTDLMLRGQQPVPMSEISPIDIILNLKNSSPRKPSR